MLSGGEMRRYTGLVYGFKIFLCIVFALVPRLSIARALGFA